MIPFQKRRVYIVQLLRVSMENDSTQQEKEQRTKTVLVSLSETERKQVENLALRMKGSHAQVLRLGLSYLHANQNAEDASQ